MTLAKGSSTPLLKEAELEPISTEVTGKRCPSVGVGREPYSSSLTTTLKEDDSNSTTGSHGDTLLYAETEDLTVQA